MPGESLVSPAPFGRPRMVAASAAQAALQHLSPLGQTSCARAQRINKIVASGGDAHWAQGRRGVRASLTKAYRRCFSTVQPAEIGVTSFTVLERELPENA